jgi:hypothetical protein
MAICITSPTWMIMIPLPCKLSLELKLVWFMITAITALVFVVSALLCIDAISPLGAAACLTVIYSWIFVLVR